MGGPGGRFLLLSGAGSAGAEGRLDRWECQARSCSASHPGPHVWVPPAICPAPSASVRFLLRSHFLRLLFPDAAALELSLHGPHCLWWDLPATLQPTRPCSLSPSQPVVTPGKCVQARAAVVSLGHRWPGRLSVAHPSPWLGRVLLGDLSPRTEPWAQLPTEGDCTWGSGPGVCPPPGPRVPPASLFPAASRGRRSLSPHCMLSECRAGSSRPRGPPEWLHFFPEAVTCRPLAAGKRATRNGLRCWIINKSPRRLCRAQVARLSMPSCHRRGCLSIKHMSNTFKR